jgi:peptidoglycan hydrolase-like protein with peptidoglycan-binding domain
MPPVPQPKPPLPVPAATGNSSTLTAAVQRELARLGVYTGTIDGLSGSRTRAAISGYQAAGGLAVTGEPSPELLALLRQPPAKPAAPAPVAAPPPAAAEAAKPDQVAAAVQRAAELEREQAAARQNDRMRRIQSALDLIGYGPLTADGQASAATADAIRRFELDNGLPVTGEPGDKVLARLVAIGAIKAN